MNKIAPDKCEFFGSCNRRDGSGQWGIFGADLVGFSRMPVLPLANTFSHLWCSPERNRAGPRGKLSFIHLGVGYSGYEHHPPIRKVVSLLEPRTWYVKSFDATRRGIPIIVRLSNNPISFSIAVLK